MGLPKDYIPGEFDREFYSEYHLGDGKRIWSELNKLYEITGNYDMHITYISEKGIKTYIGEYRSYDLYFMKDCGWLDFNENYIVLVELKRNEYARFTSDLNIIKLFDIKNNRFVKGTNDELLQIYNSEFNSIERKLK